MQRSIRKEKKLKLNLNFKTFSLQLFRTKLRGNINELIQ